MTTSEQQAVPVAQEDREAAARLAENDIRLYGTEGDGLWSVNAPAEMRSGQGDDWENVQAFARHRLDVTQTREAELLEQIAALEKRGAEAVIAYHVAICSPKGVVPDDTLYDAKMAADIQAALDAGIPVRAALNARGGA